MQISTRRRLTGESAICLSLIACLGGWSFAGWNAGKGELKSRIAFFSKSAGKPATNLDARLQVGAVHGPDDCVAHRLVSHEDSVWTVQEG